MIAVSHPTGNAFVRALLAALEERRLDVRFFTTLNAPTKNVLHLLPVRLREQIARRAFPLPRSKIVTRPVREAVRLLANAADAHLLTRHECGWASIDAVYRDLDRAVAAWVERQGGELRSVHCYEDGALETFLAAARRDVRCVYELPIAWWETAEKLLREEAERLPAWEPTLLATRDSPEKQERKTREIHLADTVICPSRFVHDSLPEAILRKKQCVIAKFGSPVLRGSAVCPRKDGKKLRLLFAGAMTQRKGLADVFGAMKMLGRADVELVVMGSPILPMQFYRDQFDAFIHEPPRPHDAVLELMRTCDALVLPSIVEGRALVQQEAMACGLPLIVTENAGGGDLVEEGVTGFLTPIRSPEKIAEKIAWLAGHRDAIPAMGEAAKRKAAECTWSDYSDAIIRAAGVES